MPERFFVAYPGGLPINVRPTMEKNTSHPFRFQTDDNHTGWLSQNVEQTIPVRQNARLKSRRFVMNLFSNSVPEI